MAPETLTLELGHDRAATAVEAEPQSGLGKGLAAILAATAVEKPRRGGLASLIPETPGSTAGPADTGPFDGDDDEGSGPDLLTPPTLGHGGDTDADDLGADLVRALLGGLGCSMPLDLCAYLHQGRTERPRLTLRSPSFSSFEPSDGFELCDLLGRRLRKGQSGPFQAAGYVGTTVATAGWASSGVYAVGRRRGLLGPPEIAAVEAFCTSLGASIHQLSEHHDEPLYVPEFQIRFAEAAMGAEAAVRLAAPNGPRQAHAWATGRVEAVATALLKAIDCGRMFRYASETEVDGERRALALLQGDDGSTALRGAAVPGGTPGTAVVLATFRAAAALSTANEQTDRLRQEEHEALDVLTRDVGLARTAEAS